MRTRKQIINAIWKERERQEEKEGYTADHDDDCDHEDGELAHAAACYAMPPEVRRLRWPATWLQEYDKRKKHSRLRQLEIAAALIVAEIERLERAAEREYGR
jgi:hypothetical protein